MLKIIILCLLSVFVPLQIEASEQLKLTGAVQTIGIQDNLDTLRVLFVGNSYTYFWGLAQLVEGLSRNGDRYIYTRTSTASGASLNDHWHRRFDLKTIEKIENGDWDVVVLQNQSRSSIDSLDQFLRYGKKLIQLIRNADAIPLIFETWAPKRDPFMQELITSAHDELARETNTKKIPIGTLWEKVKELNPDWIYTILMATIPTRPVLISTPAFFMPFLPEKRLHILIAEYKQSIIMVIPYN